MTDKPNCGNCPYPKSNTPDAYKCSYLMASVDEWEGTHKKNLLPGKDRRYNFTKVVGCLSHPGAKEWLMADVIKELEKQQEELERKARTLMFQPMGDKYASKAEGIKKAISLIRNGVNCETFKNKK